LLFQHDASAQNNTGKRSAKKRSNCMKALIVLGAIVGFLTGAAFGVAGRSPWPDALWHACAAALASGVLTRWWSRVWMQSLRDSLEQRHGVRRPDNAKPAAKT
jgi:hypothetical protein